jgi:hypothetical protein
VHRHEGVGRPARGVKLGGRRRKIIGEDAKGKPIYGDVAALDTYDERIRLHVELYGPDGEPLPIAIGKAILLETGARWYGEFDLEDPETMSTWGESDGGHRSVRSDRQSSRAESPAGISAGADRTGPRSRVPRCIDPRRDKRRYDRDHRRGEPQ